MKVSADERARICELYRSGVFSLRCLAGIFDLSHEGVRRILRSRGVPINPPYRRLPRTAPVDKERV